MLLEWTVGNFKSVAGPVTLPLAPLTLFVGANSSGKSTILQSILTVMQSLGSPVSSSPHPLILNGEYLKLGSWKDVLHQGAQDSILTIGFRLRNEDNTVTRAVSTCRLLTSSLDELPRMVLDTASLECEGTQMRIARAELDRLQQEGSLRHDSCRYRVVELVPQLAPTAQTARLDRAKVDHLLPSGIWEQYDINVHLLYETLRESEQCMRNSNAVAAAQERLQKIAIDSRVGEEFRLSLRNVLKPFMDRQTQGYETGWQLFQYCRTVGDWVKEASVKLPAPVRLNIARELRNERLVAGDRLRKSKSYKPEYGLRLRALPEPLDTYRADAVDYFAKRIGYLGPLRDDPRAIYALPPVPEDTDVGTRGEYTAAVLQHHHSDSVVCPIPGDSEYRTEKMPLREAVARWLMHMGLVDDVEAYDRGKIGTELVLHVADVRLPLDLTSVGVGVSQVLPSIVMGLLSPPGSTLLLEQPELHLHPKVQSIFGDFLLGMVHSGRQCIVESHSEYLLNRLRLRIAQAPDSRIQQLIRLYFVERLQGQSVFRPVETNEYGAITDWPRGFFDQGPDEASMILEAVKAKLQRKQGARKVSAGGW